MIVWLVSVNHFCYLINATPVWKMPCAITECMTITAAAHCHREQQCQQPSLILYQHSKTPQISLLKILILNKQKSIKQLFFIIKQTPLAWNAVFFLRLWNSHSSPHYPLDTHFYQNMACTHDLHPICPGRCVGTAVVKKSHGRQTGENIMERNQI